MVLVVIYITLIVEKFTVFALMFINLFKRIYINMSFMRHISLRILMNLSCHTANGKRLRENHTLPQGSMYALNTNYNVISSLNMRSSMTSCNHCSRMEFQMPLAFIVA